MPSVLSPPGIFFFSKMTLAWPSSASNPAAAMEAGPAPMSATFLPLFGFAAGNSDASGLLWSAVSVAKRCRRPMAIGSRPHVLYTHAPAHSTSTGHTRAHDAPSAPSWDALVAKGQFADVVREAETLGLDSVTERRGPGDLKALGQAARYVGKRALSLRAFTALRERNRGTDYARQAAFFLARLQEEQGNQAEALRWLGTYVTEAPKGVYAARGRAASNCGVQRDGANSSGRSK